MEATHLKKLGTKSWKSGAEKKQLNEHVSPN